MYYDNIRGAFHEVSISNKMEINMYHALGALVLLIGIIVLIKYIMRTGENKGSCSVKDEIGPSDEKENDDEVAEVAGIEIDIKDQD